VNPTSSRRHSQRRFQIEATGEGIANHVGVVALCELADQLGFTRHLSGLLRKTSNGRRFRHDRGRVLRDLAVTIADGGDCLSDLAVLQDQPDLFGRVASTPTAWRVVDGVSEAELEAVRMARAQARERAWRRRRLEEIVLDIDATLVTSHSEKERAAPNFKRGFGFHPLLCYFEQEALAGMLRPGNAGANTVADHLDLLDMALAQLPERAAELPILVRTDSSGASHGLLEGVRERGLEFSVGFDLTAPVREAILAVAESHWQPAITQEGEERDGAWVCELFDLDLGGWPEGTRAICRRERPHPGAQLTFTDIQGYRFQVFITDQQQPDIVWLEARHRAHARVEDSVRCGKETGLRNFPFRAFAANQVWLELALTAHDLLAHFQRVCLRGEAQLWEPKRLRYRVLHAAGRILRSGRRWILRLQRRWRWTPILYDAFRRLRALPA
jgi:hypothetical protein